MQLQPLSDDLDHMPLEECEDEMAMFEGSLEILSDLLIPGDNYAVNAEANNKEGVEFYLLRCIRPKWKTLKEVKDAWKNICLVGTTVITGHYYQQHQDNMHHYTLLDQLEPTNLYSHLVRAIKFDMPLVDPSSKTYYLSPENHEQIYNAMPYEAVA